MSNQKIILFLFINFIIHSSCGVKGPPLPPLEIRPDSVNDDSSALDSDSIKKKLNDKKKSTP